MRSTPSLPLLPDPLLPRTVVPVWASFMTQIDMFEIIRFRYNRVQKENKTPKQHLLIKCKFEGTMTAISSLLA